MDQNSAGKIPVFDVAREAYSFSFANWVRFAPAAVSMALLGSAAQLLLGPLPLGAVVAPLISAAASIIFAAAVLRLVLRQEFVSPIGLAAGQDEVRLLGVAAGLGLMFGLPLLLVGGVFITMLMGRLGLTQAELTELTRDPAALMSALESVVRPADSLVVMMVLLAAIYISARLAMVNAATMGERRMVALQTWGWSRGNVVGVISVVILAGLPSIITATVADLLTRLIGSSPSVLVLFFAASLAGVVGNLLSLPAIAVGGILYRGLRPPDFKPK